MSLLKDIQAVRERDPAAQKISTFEILLCYSGVHALLMHRLAHYLHTRWGLSFIPRLISQVSRFFTGIEIHPGVKIGNGFFIDHGMGVVLGETSEIHDNVTIFQGVTLGGTGNEQGKRHPTLRDNVTVGVGAKVLGSITIGEGSYIGAGSVVLKDVPPNSTVVGVPGRIVIHNGERVRGASLDHTNLPDPILDKLQELQREIDRIESDASQMDASPGEAHVPKTLPSESGGAENALYEDESGN